MPTGRARRRPRTPLDPVQRRARLAALRSRQQAQVDADLRRFAALGWTG